MAAAVVVVVAMRHPKKQGRGRTEIVVIQVEIVVGLMESGREMKRAVQAASPLLRRQRTFNQEATRRLEEATLV